MTSLMMAVARVVTYVGRLVAGDDVDVDITSRSRDPVHRHVLVWSVSQQQHADCTVSRRDVRQVVRSVANCRSL